MKIFIRITSQKVGHIGTWYGWEMARENRGYPIPSLGINSDLLCSFPALALGGLLGGLKGGLFGCRHGGSTGVNG